MKWYFGRAGTVGWDMIAFSYCRGLRHGLSEEKRKRDRAKWSERLRGVGKARWKTYEDSSGEIGYACRLSLSMLQRKSFEIHFIRITFLLSGFFRKIGKYWIVPKEFCKNIWFIYSFWLSGFMSIFFSFFFIKNII